MNITHITNSLARTAAGVSYVVWSLAQAQKEAGANVSILGTRDPFDHHDWPDNKLSVDVFPHVGPLRFGFTPGLSRHLIDPEYGGNIDLLHQHGLWTFITNSVTKWQKRWAKPTIISTHGALDKWAISHHALRKHFFSMLFEQKNLNYASCIHALCESEAKDIRAYGLKNPVVVIPNGVNLDDYSALPRPDQFTELFPKTKDKNILLFMSRIHPKKGLENLCLAWSDLHLEYPDWILVIAGPDQAGHTKEIQALASKTNLLDKLLFTGPLYGTDKIKAFSAADAFVLPSFSEGVPIVLLEAMAAGLPVLATQECNIPEIEEAGAGILCNPNHSNIADSLRLLLSISNDERIKLGAAGKKLVAKRYSWDTISTQMIAVYQWIINGGSTPDCIR